MQVSSLPRHERERFASRRSLHTAKPRSRATRSRAGALALAHGLMAGGAAKGVGSSRASLYRWAKRLEPKSRRPHRARQKTWTPALMRAVERIRSDNPMWGKEKIFVLLTREGIAASVSMVGRILKSLMERGVVTPIPTLRRRPGGRRFRIIGQTPHAKRLPKGMS